LAARLDRWPSQNISHSCTVQTYFLPPLEHLLNRLQQPTVEHFLLAIVAKSPL
jgi:hypothetical protein